ncbi:MAG: response regulator transcription factor [Dehalococcoidia bacterium]|nr:MAG: response regulator transcription factor [Dehalococcoidia bacterium]
MKALIIEDDPEIVESVSLSFRIRWPEAQLVSTHLGRKGIELAESEDPDIVILDLGLPDISGFEVLREVRSFSSVPIIILTIKAEEASIVRGLEWGADDYVVKPCGQLELLARVKARIRDRDNLVDESPLSFGSLLFNPSTRQLLYGKEEINITAIEAHIIHYLMRMGGRVATYIGLAEEVWGDDYPGSVDSLRVHIRRLREKLETDPSHPQIVLTKAGLGYFLAKLG